MIGVTIAVAICAAAFLVFRKGPGCTSALLTEMWSADRAYSAALHKKDCNQGESILYSVRVDAHSPPLRIDWSSNYELRNDKYPDQAPSLLWRSDRELEITVKTRTLRGKLQVNAGDDLTITEAYDPSDPNAFPNY